MQIDSKWTDAEGNLWYKTLARVKTGEWARFKGQWLIKLSKGATVWECTWKYLYTTQEFDPAHYPKEIRPDVFYPVFYNIRHRAAS